MKQTSVSLTIAILLYSVGSVHSKQWQGKLHSKKALEAGMLRESENAESEVPTALANAFSPPRARDLPTPEDDDATGLQQGPVQQQAPTAASVAFLSHRQSVAQTNHKSAKHEGSLNSNLVLSLHDQSVQKHRIEHQQRMEHKHFVELKVDLCNGNRYGWMVSIRQQCKDSYGDESVWNRNRGEGACEEAWEECNSAFASTCCTQPEGPRDMAAYCAKEENSNDRACAVQQRMQAVQGSMTGIRNAVGTMNTATPPPPASPTVFDVLSGNCRTVDAGRCVVSPNWPEEYENDDECEIQAPSQGVNWPRVKLVTADFETESCCDKLSVGARTGGAIFSGSSEEDGPDEELEGGPVMTWSTDFSAAGPGWKVCAEDIVPAPTPSPPGPAAPHPAPLCLQDSPANHSVNRSANSSVPSGLGVPTSSSVPVQVWVPCPAPATAPAPVGVSRARAAPAPAPAAGKPYGPRKPSKLEMQCQSLTAMVQAAAQNMDEIRAWSEHDGIISSPLGREGHAAGHGTSLLATMAQVVSASSSAGTSEAKDPDLTFAVRNVLNAGTGLDALRNAPLCGKPPGPPEDDDDSDDDDEEGDSDVADDDDSDVAVAEEPPKINGSAVSALLEFEGGMESAVGAFESGVHPHGRKWWRYRYEYTLVESLVLSFSVMMLFVLMYVLSGVSFFHKFKFYNIGITTRLYRFAWAYFLFHSTALMIMVTLAYMLYMPWGKTNIFDLLAKPFHEWVDGRANVPFLGYSWLMMILDVQFQLFVCFALYTIFILCVTRNWARALDDWKAMMVPDSRKRRLAINDYHYRDFQNILTERVQKWEAFAAMFREKQLRYHPIEGTDRQLQQGVHDFQTHLYLTDTFGKSLDYLVEVSLSANVFLAVCALVIAFLAHHYQVAFMYFLPAFVIIGIVIFAASYFISGKLKSHDHTLPLDWVTLHTYCRSVQLIMYCVFFSFARLLLSHDIYSDFPKVYLASCIGLAVTLILAWLAAGEIMKSTICHISLPHKSALDRFGHHLGNVAYWHLVSTCHECGVRQVPANASTNREWAGTKAMPLTSPRFEGGPADSARIYSFR